MILDDVMIVIILAGIALAAAYLKAEYAWHVRCKAHERSRQGFQRHLSVARAALEHNGIAVHVRIVHAPLQQRPAIKFGRAFQLLAAVLTVATLSGAFPITMLTAPPPHSLQ